MEITRSLDPAGGAQPGAPSQGRPARGIGKPGSNSRHHRGVDGKPPTVGSVGGIHAIDFQRHLQATLAPDGSQVVLFRKRIKMTDRCLGRDPPPVAEEGRVELADSV